MEEETGKQTRTSYGGRAKGVTGQTFLKRLA